MIHCLKAFVTYDFRNKIPYRLIISIVCPILINLQTIKWIIIRLNKLSNFTVGDGALDVPIALKWLVFLR